MPLMNAETVIARSGGECEARLPGAGCTRNASELHHRRFRSGGEDHSISNLGAICKPCHDWIHGNKSTAREYGWAISSHTDERPSEVPVHYRGRMALLSDAGFAQFIIPGVPQL